MICNVFLLGVAGRDPPAPVVAATPRPQWSRRPLGCRWCRWCSAGGADSAGGAGGSPFEPLLIPKKVTPQPPYQPSGWSYRYIYIGGWGVWANQETDFGFGCACVACVRAFEAVCGRVGRRVSPGLGRKIEFSMVPGARPPARTREMQTKRFHFFET